MARNDRRMKGSLGGLRDVGGPIRKIGGPINLSNLSDEAPVGADNPQFGEAGWLSARPLADPMWADWYDRFLAGGGGNPIDRADFNEMAAPGPQGSNQLRGLSSQQSTPIQIDPYYNVEGLGPGYDPRQSPKGQIRKSKGSSLRGLRQAVSNKPDMEIL